MTRKIVRLPDGFIGKEDEARLESFGAHLISHGFATRWHWRRENGIHVGFEIFHRGADEELLVSIRRDRRRDAFIAQDAHGREIGNGTLERVMTAVDALSRHDERPRPSG